MAVITGTNQRDIIAAEADGDVVMALEGNDVVSSAYSDVTLIGGDGDDRYRLYDSDVTVVEEEDGGHDTIWAWRSLEMPDNVEDVLFKGVGNIQYIMGNALDNTITSGDGIQTLAGRTGNDTLQGGAGTDTFYFEAGDGHDWVVDFTPGVDKVSLWGLGVDTLDDLLLLSTDTADGALVSWGTDQSILFEGVAVADFTADDFGLNSLPDDFLDGATLTFEDTFDDASSLTDGTWNTQRSNGHPVTAAVSHGKRYYTYVDETSESADGTVYGINPFSVEDGILSISAEPTPEHLQDVIPEDWVTGLLETHGKFAQTYGYYEVRAKTPEGQGYWPAVWLISENFQWPPELNILEQLGSETYVQRVGVHSLVWGQHTRVNEELMVPDTSEDFHTYGMLWTPETITFTFDGKVIFETPTPEGMHEPMSLRINLGVGGWEGEPDETTDLDETFDIDYVRVYQIAGIDDIAKNTDDSDHYDEENGILNVTTFKPEQFYADTVLRTSELGVPDLSLADGQDATLVGDDNANHLVGNSLANVLNAEGGNDSVDGGDGNDYLIGGDGDDSLDGGSGADTMVGGTGDDVYYLSLADGTVNPDNDLILERPDEGFDTVVFQDIQSTQIRSYMEWARWHIVAETTDGPTYFTIQISPGIGGVDIGTRIEQIIFADGVTWDLTGGLTLIGDDEDNSSSGSEFGDTIEGEGGNDSLFGMNGDDSMDGGQGIDDVYGWNGNDTLNDTGSEGGDRLFGEAGEDTVRAGEGWDSIYGGDGDDSLYTSSDGDAAFGQAGDDTIKGRAADDSMEGGDGNDLLVGSSGNDALSGGADNDRLSGGGGNDSLLGEDGADTLIGSAGVDTLDGGAGRDILRGGSGDDVFRFVFDEIENDKIADFNAGDSIEIDITGTVDNVDVSIAGKKILLTMIDTGDVAQITANGATEADLFFF